MKSVSFQFVAVLAMTATMAAAQAAVPDPPEAPSAAPLPADSHVAADYMIGPGDMLQEGMTVLDAVLACGGVAQFAAGNRTKLIRTEKGKTREIRIHLDSLVNNGDLKQNLLLLPGDVLVVPESRF